MRYFAVECLTPGVQFLQGFWICTVLFACMTCIFTGVLDLHGIVCLHDGHLAGRGVLVARGWLGVARASAQGQLRPKDSWRAPTTAFLKTDVEPRTSCNLGIEGVRYNTFCSCLIM